MAEVRVELMVAAGRSLDGGSLQLPASIPALPCAILTSGSQAVTAVDATGDVIRVDADPSQRIWSVTVSGGAVWARFDGEDAAEGHGFKLYDGESRSWHASAVGETCSIIDA